MKKKKTIMTMAELERLMPEIIAKVNKDQKLAIRAASNPFLALEEMGYVLDQELSFITYRRLRHSKATSEHLNELAEKIYNYAGKRFDIGDESQLEEVLFKRLRLEDPIMKAMKKTRGKETSSVPGKVDLRSPEPTIFGKKGVGDRLERAQGVHPVMKPLLEYRSIDAKVPRYATREIYEKIKDGEIKVPITMIKLRITRKLATED